MMNVRKGRYICTAGETFDSVALALFEDEKYAWQLMEANPEMAATRIFTGGEKLRIPDIPISEDDGEEEYTGSVAPWRT